MQVYANSNRVPLKTILFLIIILFFAYLPISSFLFFLKNDAFTGYFPPKFFMGESIHAGYLPLWNPYINFGIPQYGDMSGGYWSPITWLIAATTGYNAYTFTFEVLFYILLGGIGIYQLTGLFKLVTTVRIMAAIAFMCSGYNIGHLQHFNWLSGAALLPWCFWSYLMMLRDFSIKTIVGAVLLFYMLLASAHPGIIISAFYFFLGLLIFHLFNNDHGSMPNKTFKKLIAVHGIFIILLLLLSVGMITGYLDIMPSFSRSEKIGLADSLSDPTNLQSWISTLLPFATVKGNAFYSTDISMRNSYFGIVFLLFFILACFSKKTNWQKFLLSAGLVFALLSAGGVFKIFAYKFIPLIGYVRLNGEFRIFSLLCFILFAAIELNKFIQQKNNFQGKIKWVWYALVILLTGFVTVGFYKGILDKQSVLFTIPAIIDQNITKASKFKLLIDAISIYDTFWIQTCIQLLFLWGIKRCLHFERWTILQSILIADMIIASLLNIPFTGVGKTSVADVQQVLNKSPKGFPIPDLKPIKNNVGLPSLEEAMVGDWSLYSKQIGVTHKVAYPIVLKRTAQYFDNSERFPKDNFLDMPFIFQPGITNTKNLKIVSFSPNKIIVECTSDSINTIVLQQNYYPHWFYNNGITKKNMDLEGINFMSAPLVKGKNHLTFSFEPTSVKWAMLLSAIMFVLYCLLLFIPWPKPSSPS